MSNQMNVHFINQNELLAARVGDAFAGDPYETSLPVDGVAPTNRCWISCERVWRNMKRKMRTSATSNTSCLRSYRRTGTKLQLLGHHVRDL